MSYRNKVIIVDIDSSRNPNQILILEAEREEGKNQVKASEKPEDVIHQMAVLCEGLCCLIHAAEDLGIKKSSDSLKDCINHLKEGFMDSSYFTILEQEQQSKN